MRLKLTAGTIIATALLWMTAAPGPAYASLADYSWDIIDLGMVDVTGINDAGQVSGNIKGGSLIHAALWSNGTITDLQPSGAQYDYSNAYDINNSGQVLINVTSHQYMDPVPFVWSQGTATQLIPYGAGAEGYAINDTGTAVGFSIAQDIAAMWGTTPYPSFKPRFISEAYDINNRGQIVGYNSLVTSDYKILGQYGAIWDQTSVTMLMEFNAALAINDSGQVVGINKEGRVGLWDSGSITDIGPSLPYPNTNYAINNMGQVVGMIDGNRPYIWDNGTTIDLNSLAAGSGWSLTAAHDINDNGEIVGLGITPDGKQSSYLLTPTTKLAPTPIPAILPLLVAGLTALELFGKRKGRN